MDKKYRVIFDEVKQVIIEAENKEQAEEFVKMGEFDNNEVENLSIDLESVRAEEIIN